MDDQHKADSEQHPVEEWFPGPDQRSTEYSAAWRDLMSSQDAERETAAPAPRQLTDAQLAEVLGLIPGVDSVELKLTIPESEQRTTLDALEIDPLQAQIRQVFFFDTPDLALNQQGVVVRARRVQAKQDDSVVKLRPVVPADLPRSLRKSPSFGVELDAMPGGFVCSATMKRVFDGGVRDAAAGRRPLKDLFSKEQRAFLRAHAPAGITLDDLSVLGPIFVLKLKFSPEGLGRKLVAELWLYPDDSRILELSTKCAPPDAFQVAAEARAFLYERGINVAGEQETKTRRALDFFRARLAARADGVSQEESR
jgi:hypothetical protein